MKAPSPDRSEMLRLSHRLASTRWADLSACYDHDPDLWWPEKGTDNAHGIAAKLICSGCPSREPCLIDSLARYERFGIRGGAGGSWRRGLRQAFIRSTHPQDEHCDDEACVWCRTFDEHWRRLDAGAWYGAGATEPPLASFTPGSRHGRRATQARGCRCVPCVWSASKYGQELAAAGIDTTQFWNDHTGDIPMHDHAHATAAALIATVEAGVELGHLRKNGAVHQGAQRLRGALANPVEGAKAA